MALRLKVQVEAVLTAVGYTLTLVDDALLCLCCGSVGTFSLLQPVLSKSLCDNKLHAMQVGGAEHIAPAIIGCITHLRSGTGTPVCHWIEFFDALLIYRGGPLA